MLVRYDLVRPENGLYAAHAAFLRGRGIPVPRVVADLPADNAAVMEDLGDLTLEQAVAGLSAARREAIYRRVLEALLRMHAIPGRDLARRGTRLEPPFSESLYRWERELLARHTLRPLFGLSAREIRGIMDELEGLSRALLRARPVLVHRDMQSSNILLRGGRPWFLDFQGMRMGPAAYDVASLLCDPYVMLRPDEQGRLLLYYARRSPRGAETAALFWAAVAQRLAQALGAFGRLAADHRTRRFAGYIRPGLQMMDRALERLDGMPLTRRFVREALSRWPAGVSGG
jgi:aminoglycoside/choline kinase family phosphotransferase